MRVYASLKNSFQTPDGNTYTAIFGDAEPGEVIGIPCAVFRSIYGDIYVPTDAITATAAFVVEDPEMGAHVLVL